jgi:uncharacterized OsmC-like protein
MKTIADMKLSGDVKNHARTVVSTRDVSVTIDEPEARGGTNQGLTPTETLMASLIGCTNVITQRIAHHKGVTVGAMHVDAAAKFDRRGVSLQEEIEVPFQSVQMTIDIQTDASAEQMEEIKRDLGKFCPIAKVIRNAGTPIDEVWNVTPL